MAYFDDDYNDEDVFEGVPCEFCKRLFPFEDIVIHETGCEYDLVRVTEPLRIEPFVAQEINIEASSKTDLKAPVEKENVSLPKDITPLLKEITPEKKDTPKREQSVKDDFSEYEVLGDHLLETETFAFASGKNKEKKVEKETPSFKKPPILNLNSNEVKCLIQNNLPDSDNEETESLEKFWKKAEIKLAGRLRGLENKN